MNRPTSHRFFEWHLPDELRQTAEVEAIRLGQMALLRPGKKYREAYVASRFAAFRKALSVRLLPESNEIVTPDFEMKVGEIVQRFEITEADRPGRRRGDEDRSTIERVEPVPDDEWTDPDEYQALVEYRARTKADKSYNRCEGLIIWSNAWPIANEQALTLDWWRTACKPAENAFAEVWVGANSELRNSFQRIF